ncbi:MAG: complex I 51 kDa subunit family protein [Lachnospiraceae bacterium]
MNNKIISKRFGKLNDPASVSEYRAMGGYTAIQQAILTDKERILAEIDTAMVLGRGGASYPMGRKWHHLYENPRFPKYIVCNADEGEPGTFKDKALLSLDPHSVIEGMLIAGYLFSADAGFIYIRGEYRTIQETFQRALDDAEQNGYLGQDILGVKGFNYTITIVSGAGAYVCGENSAMLNSIEGLTGRPRVKPPHLADIGLYKQPTLVNNVESFANVPVVLNMGGEAYRALGTEKDGGTRLICLSGHIKNRGMFEIPLGMPLDEIIYGEEYGGGMASGKPLSFIHFGGQSGPIGFPEQLEGLTYSYEEMRERGLAIGSGALVVMDDSVSVVEYLESVMGFFIHESCGKCTPCRLGTTRLHELIGSFVKGRAGQEDLSRLENMLTHITNLSSCGLGQSVATSVRCAIRHRRNEFAALIGN